MRNTMVEAAKRVMEKRIEKQRKKKEGTIGRTKKKSSFFKRPDRSQTLKKRAKSADFKKALAEETDEVIDTLKDALARSGSATKKKNIASYNVNVSVEWKITKNADAEESMEDDEEDSGTERGKNNRLTVFNI